ncbi:MAG TPA: NlpC/P60 family protein [Ignavibacteria bacterium]|nr:NlpC/P60 family protein [Ignavibacteria bacterium]
MVNLNLSRLPLLMAMIFAAVVLVGCSGSKDISNEDNDENYSSKDVNGYKNSKELVSTSTLKNKTSINKDNLETISSSLAGFISSADFKSNIESDEVMTKIIEYINTPYLWGGTSKRGIDCSAFIQTIMYQSLGVTLPRTSLEQSGVGEPVEKADLKFGDLIFFDTMRKGRVTHVGMYLSNGYFAHSGSKTGVAVASLDDEFYTRTYLKARRVTSN